LSLGQGKEVFKFPPNLGDGWFLKGKSNGHLLKEWVKDSEQAKPKAGIHTRGDSSLPHMN
jgi:hypothetical protein